jgi:hypothetical protein
MLDTLIQANQDQSGWCRSTFRLPGGASAAGLMAQDRAGDGTAAGARDRR